jgi:hypothetical protein
MLYVGSHYGSTDDGYVCSSKWMKRAYKRRPSDFKRRIIYWQTTPDRKELLETEQRWLSLIAALETSFSMSAGPPQRQGDYNPMEPSHRTSVARNWPWLAQR